MYVRIDLMYVSEHIALETELNRNMNWVLTEAKYLPREINMAVYLLNGKQQKLAIDWRYIESFQVCGITNDKICYERTKTESFKSWKQKRLTDF